jgi:xanthine dehydrogenase accessory factor
VKRETLVRLLADSRAQQPVVLVTDLASGAQRLLHPGEGGVEPGLGAAAEAALRSEEAQRFESEAGTFFLQPFAPPLRLIVVGAVHIAQPLAAMAALAGWAVVIVDPRQAFASEARFPGVTLRSDWPDAAVEALAPDARTALVTLTHDPKLDDPALLAGLRSPAFYVGALGSKKTHQARLGRLRALGLGESELARIHAPVGLDLGARSPAEIAVSILAELTLRLRGPKR